MVFLNLILTSPAKSTQAHDPQFDLFLPPVIFKEGDNIPYYLEQMNLPRIASITSNLVTHYGPRHHKFFQIFSDECRPEGKPYSVHNLNRASTYVFEAFKALGYTPYREWVPDWHGTYNVIAQKTGSVYPNLFIEIGAHLDTVATTSGASDNAGSVAAVLEIARVLKDYPNRHSIRFISFVGEENYLRGSRHHISLVESKSEQIKAGLILDEIGYSELAPEHMNCLWDNGGDETRRISNLFNAARQEYDIDIGWRLCEPDGQWSDNYAYWERGYPAVLSIGNLPIVDPNYHSCGDNLATVDLQNVYKTALENLAVLLKLDAELSQPSDLSSPKLQTTETITSESK